MAAKTFAAERMQTNAAWAQNFALVQPDGTTPVDLTGWTIEGRAEPAARRASFLDLTAANGRLLIGAPASGEVTVSLSPADTAALGPGIVEIEIMRLAPAPKRPLLRAQIENHEGIAL